MDFVANREVFLPALSKVIGVVERRQTLPILGNLLVVAQGETVTLTGSDLEVEVRTEFGANVKEEGETTVPARKLVDICRNLAEGTDVRMRLKDERCVVTAGRGRFSLGYLAAAGFPAMGLEEGGFEFDVEETRLKRMLEKCSFAMAQQDVRYYLNGLFMELRSSLLTAVATDGHRLAKFVVSMDLAIDEPRQVIIPTKTVMELKRQLNVSEDSVRLSVGEKSLRILLGQTAMTSKLVDGRYPDYEQVIPRDLGEVAILDKDALRRSLSRAAILSNEKYRGVRLSFGKGILKLLAHNPEQEEAEEEIEIDYDGEPVSVAFNVAYMMDVLGAVDAEKVEIRFQVDNKSSIWKGEGSEDETFVVMPMRL
ncbi:DNA polymerase III subunit beta [Thiorhodococcus mannitoliphagus]|uniref:Beta sliding clamp n=1 Tax=Thiorhodococcus mannitoliphagus TaxID=329406 RepID=A0A6P1DPE3_9GAMM|nr:DNA polymerase III subunit beta [Thiorhodococcus mannitoliphagus]NEX18771.1 DNA polymerase III subunit beta [Thiorhodococcus mannitoliphagus]